jgi:hypothetical protein
LLSLTILVYLVVRTLVFILLSTLALCQEIKILIAKGRVEYFDTAWHKVKAGYTLKDGTTVRLQDSSYLALVTGSRALEFKKPGVYKVTLSEYKPNPYVSKYSGYVLNQAIASGSGRNTGKTLGAVCRTTLAPIIYTPSNTKFFSDSIVLSWERIPNVGQYLVYIKNEHGHDIDTLSTESNEITYKVTSVQHSRRYYFSVATARYPTIASRPVGFTILGAKETDSLKNALQCFIDEVDTNTCIGRLLFMESLNDNQLYGYGLCVLRDILLHCPFIYEEAYSRYILTVKH